MTIYENEALGKIMIHPRTLTLITLMCAGCNNHISPQEARPKQRDIVTARVGFAGTPILTPAQIGSISTLFDTKKFTTIEELQASLPPGLKFFPAGYGLISEPDSEGKQHPYTETVSVCRLSAQYDLVVIEDNRTGSSRISSHYIRDLIKEK